MYVLSTIGSARGALAPVAMSGGADEVDDVTRTQARLQESAAVYEDAYFRQEAAVRFSMESNYLPVFARDNPKSHSKNAKRYLVAGWRIFYERQARLPADKRSFFELLGDDTPCHVYVDCEWQRDINPEVSVATLYACIRAFKHFLVFELHDELALIALSCDEPQRADENDDAYADRLVPHVVSTSSRDNKESYHVVLRLLDGALMLANMCHVGAIVRRFDRWLCGDDDEPRFRIAVPSDAAGDAHAFLFDMSVYTSNRCFRVPYSSKAGECRILVFLDAQRCVQDAATMPPYADFVRGLVTYMDARTVRWLAAVTEHDGASPASTSHTTAHLPGTIDAVQDARVVRATTRILAHAGGAPRRPTQPSRYVRWSASRTDNEAGAAHAHDYFEAAADLLYEHDAPVLAECARATLRMSYSDEAGRIRINTHAHYCHAAARKHAHNHVYYIIDLGAMTWHQRCFNNKAEGCARHKPAIHALDAAYAARFRAIMAREEAENTCVLDVLFAFHDDKVLLGGGDCR